jgi:hypothetical protein
LDRLDRAVCLKYNVKPKKIKENILFKIVDLLTKQFYDIRILDGETWNCDYDCLIQVGEDDKNSDDEHAPNNQGYGWGLREAVLSVLLSDKVLNDSFVYDDIRYLLMSNVEKMKEILWI